MIYQPGVHASHLASCLHLVCMCAQFTPLGNKYPAVKAAMWAIRTYEEQAGITASNTNRKGTPLWRYNKRLEKNHVVEGATSFDVQEFVEAYMEALKKCKKRPELFKVCRR